MSRQETSVLPHIAQAGPEHMFSHLRSLSSDIRAMSHYTWRPSAWDKKIVLVFTPDREGSHRLNTSSEAGIHSISDAELTGVTDRSQSNSSQHGYQSSPCYCSKTRKVSWDFLRFLLFLCLCAGLCTWRCRYEPTACMLGASLLAPCQFS